MVETDRRLAAAARTCGRAFAIDHLERTCTVTHFNRAWRPVAVALVLGALVLLPAIASRQDAVAQAAAAQNARLNRAQFHDAMRQLWEDHITWTRLFIVSATGDLADLEATTARLLRNQDDIGDAIKPFYGEAAGEALATLLRGHITGAATLLAAARSGDAAAVEAASVAWYANADAIAAFLAQANPDAWPAAEMRSMMREHLDLTLAEAVARLEGRHADEVALYDRIHLQILHMADMLSDGIVGQFPSSFAR